MKGLTGCEVIMSQTFDAYHVWLGIPPAEQPPSYYRLLGLRPFEPNLTVIDHAAHRVSIHLRSLQNGPHGHIAQRLSSEVSAAGLCLLDPSQKAQYDQVLRRRQAANQVAAAPPPPSAAPAQYAQPTMAVSSRRPANRSTGRSRQGPPAIIPQSVKIFVGGIVGIVCGYLLVVFATGNDFLGILPMPHLPKARSMNQSPSSAAQKVVPSRDAQPSVALRSDEARARVGLQYADAPRPDKGDRGRGVSKTADTNKPATKVDPPVADIPSGAIDIPEIPALAVDGVEKLPQPTAEERQKMLLELQSIYKTDFAGGDHPDGRKQFVSFLLETSRKLTNDSTARYVLCREAFERAIRFAYFESAAEAIDDLEMSFDVDGYRLRLHLLAEASRTPSSTSKRRALIEFAFAMADYAQSADRISDIPKLVAIVEEHLRAMPRDARTAFTSRLGQLREVAELLSPVVSSRARLQEDPADELASLIDGKYRCFVRHDWDAGLTLLAQSKHSALAATAKKDLAGALTYHDEAVIAEMWFDLGISDPALLGSLVRAKYWYELAAKTAPPLERVKYERRLALIASKLPQRLLEHPGLAAPTLASAQELLTGQSATD